MRVADALDMEEGRSRVPFEANRPNIHSLSAAAIEDVRIDEGDDRAIRIEIEMNNSAGIFQVDELLATKLRGSGLEDHVEVRRASTPSTRSDWCRSSGSRLARARARSSVDRALASGARGRRFESCRAR